MLIDELMPVYDLRTRHERIIAAPAELVYQAASAMTIRKLIRVRLLLWIREFPSRLTRRPLEDFPVVAARPGEEIVRAICGPFWAFSGNILAIPVGDIPAFERPGYAKAYWNFTVRRLDPHTALVATEVRVRCYGIGAQKKFRAYWSLVGPFAGWIRLWMLRAIEKEALANAQLV